MAEELSPLAATSPTAGQLPSAEPSDRAEPHSSEVPRPEINHLFFPPRGTNRPTLRQVLSEPCLEKNDFLGSKTEWPTDTINWGAHVRKPDPRDDPSVVKDEGLRTLLEHLDGHKRHKQMSPMKRKSSEPTQLTHHLPSYQAVQIMQAPCANFREQLQVLNGVLDEGSVTRRKEQRQRHERAKATERMKDDVSALQTFAKRCAERADWTYCDPPGYFEKPLKIERDKSHTDFKIDNLQGIYDVKNEKYKPPHFEFNVYGGWAPHSTNEREAELDLFALPPKHYAKPIGKPKRLEELDQKIIMLDREILIRMGDTSVNKAALEGTKAELERMKAEQKEEEKKWLMRTVPPGSEKVTYQEEAPAPGGPRPARLSPSEAYFAQRLDRELFKKERIAAKELVLKTMGTHRKRRMEATCHSFSCLARKRADGKPAWSEVNTKELQDARVNFYATTSPRTDNNEGKKFNSTKKKLPVLEYFSEYEPSKPGDHPYETGMSTYITQPERATSVERNMIVGERASFWNAPGAGNVSGSMTMHARAQAIMCPPACSALLTSDRAIKEFKAIKEWKYSNPHLSGTGPLDAKKTKPRAASHYLKKNEGGGSPCRNSSNKFLQRSSIAISQ